MTGYSKDRQLGRREATRGTISTPEMGWDIPSELIEDDTPSSPLLPTVRVTPARAAQTPHNTTTTPPEPLQTPARAQTSHHDASAEAEPPPAHAAENTPDTEQKSPKDRRKALPETKHYLLRDLPLSTWRAYEEIARKHHRSVNYVLLRAIEAALHVPENELS